jgi:hypothetical protein
MIINTITWKRADTKRIMESMVRHNYFGFAEEPTQDECLDELYEMFEVKNQEDDDKVQVYINRQFIEKLRVGTPP